MAFFKGAAKEAQRAMMLQKAREKERQDIEAQKRKLEAEMRIGNINNKFAVHYDAVESRLKTDTIGLVTLDEMRAKQEQVISAREQQLASTENQRARLENDGKRDKDVSGRVLRMNKLSFDPDNEEEQEDDEDSRASDEQLPNEKVEDCEIKKDESEVIMADTKDDDFKLEECREAKRRRLGKNPDVDTSFLPDRERDEEENRLREQFRREWVLKQNAIKNEEISITYSYWDGSGHRRSVVMKKGHSIQQFLRRCLEQMRKSFPELRHVSEDQLMYVKEDLIIPYHYTFYDFIVNKARGKSGPLFHFDVHDDVRLRHDASLEKDESHAGKVCLRSWYERNKHIFPASRWEPYDPTKNWDQYSVKDKMAPKITVK